MYNALFLSDKIFRAIVSQFDQRLMIVGLFLRMLSWCDTRTFLTFSVFLFRCWRDLYGLYWAFDYEHEAWYMRETKYTSFRAIISLSFLELPFLTSLTIFSYLRFSLLRDYSCTSLSTRFECGS